MRHATAAVILVAVTRPSLPGSREIRFFRSRVARVMLRLAVSLFFKKREAVVLREESNTAVECISRADTCQAMLAWRTSCLRLILATDNVCARADVGPEAKISVLRLLAGFAPRPPEASARSSDVASDATCCSASICGCCCCQVLNKREPAANL